MPTTLPFAVSLIAKAAPGPFGVRPNDVLVFLGVFAVGTTVATLVSAALFRAGVALHNRFSQPENQTPEVSYLKALLVGFLHVGALLVVMVVLSIGVNLLLMLILQGLGGGPDAAYFVALTGIQLLTQLAGNWSTKALLATGFIPCRFRSAAIIAAVWFVFEFILGIVIYGAIGLALYWTDGFADWRFMR
jgi:hypothetical protein